MAQKPTLLPNMPFIGAATSIENAKIVIFGCPFDSTSSFRPGSRFGPAAIRAVSDVLETYDPVLRRDLDDVAYADVGDLMLPPGDTEAALEETYRMAAYVCGKGQIPAGLGGEHSLSFPLIRAVAERNEDLAVVHFDAHIDMRDQYLGVSLSHASVMRRVMEMIGPQNILQIGPRSGTRDEFQQAEVLGNLRTTDISGEEIRDWVGDRPLYVTVDLDVLDPSVFPGTGTPEPGGVSFGTLQSWLGELSPCRWAGWDVMELSPHWDPTQVSSIVAAKTVRTMLLVSA
jgi:agmatinase